MKSVLAIGVTAGFLMACGSGGGDDPVAPVNSSSSAFVPVSVSVSEAFAGGASLSLAAAESFSGSIAGCLSGYSKAITQATASVNVMDGDKNCVFKLTSLVFGGETFNMLGSESWANGSVFNVTGGSGTLMTFQVITNLAATISGAQNVNVLFATQQEGSSQTIAAAVSAGFNIEGADPINLDVDAESKSAVVDGTDGAGLFSFKLECGENLVGTDGSATCSAVNVAGLKIGLAKDTFSSVLSVDECRTLATSGGSGTVINLSSDPQVPHGGLATGQLKGPATLFDPANANLVMAIADPAAGGGCKFFLISVTPPQ